MLNEKLAEIKRYIEQEDLPIAFDKLMNLLNDDNDRIGSYHRIEFENLKNRFARIKESEGIGTKFVESKSIELNAISLALFELVNEIDDSKFNAKLVEPIQSGMKNVLAKEKEEKIESHSKENYASGRPQSNVAQIIMATVAVIGLIITLVQIVCPLNNSETPKEPAPESRSIDTLRNVRGTKSKDNDYPKEKNIEKPKNNTVSTTDFAKNGENVDTSTNTEGVNPALNDSLLEKKKTESLTNKKDVKLENTKTNVGLSFLIDNQQLLSRSIVGIANDLVKNFNEVDNSRFSIATNYFPANIDEPSLRVNLFYSNPLMSSKILKDRTVKINSSGDYYVIVYGDSESIQFYDKEILDGKVGDKFKERLYTYLDREVNRDLIEMAK